MARPLARETRGSYLPIRIKVRKVTIIAVENYEMATAVVDGLLIALSKHTELNVTAKDLSIVYESEPI